MSSLAGRGGRKGGRIGPGLRLAVFVRKSPTHAGLTDFCIFFLTGWYFCV